MGSSNGDCVSGEDPVWWGPDRRWCAAIELPELISAPAKPQTLASSLKGLHLCHSQKVHNGESPSPFTRIDNDLLPIGHGQHRRSIAESVTITEVPVRGFIKIDGRCPSAIDDPKTAVADDTLSDRIREEGEERCSFVLQSGNGS